jgi:hypothetical protein
MSQSVCLICSENISKIFNKIIIEIFIKYSVSENNYIIIKNNDMEISISGKYKDYSTINDDYLDFDNVSEEFIKNYKEYKYIYINYDNIDYMNLFLEKIYNYFESNKMNNIWFDNDYGNIISFTDMIQYLKNKNDWRVSHSM